MLASVNIGSTQQSLVNDPISQHVRNLLQPTSASEEAWDQLSELVDHECARVATAPPAELKTEELWLDGIVRHAKSRHRTAFSTLGSLVTARTHAKPQDRPSPEHFERALTLVSDARMEVAVVALVNARVGECIEKRKRTLGGEDWMTGSWKAKCTAAPGITPDTHGRITLQLTSGTVRGTVYPGARPVGADVSGPLGAYGDFSARTKENKEQKVTVSGRFDNTYPLRGSGTIVLGGEVPGYGAWECVGTWRND